MGMYYIIWWHLNINQILFATWQPDVNSIFNKKLKIKSELNARFTKVGLYLKYSTQYFINNLIHKLSIFSLGNSITTNNIIKIIETSTIPKSVKRCKNISYNHQLKLNVNVS